MIFLYRFDIKGNGLDFVLNEAIAEDMYDDVHERLIPHVEAAGNLLNFYKRKSISNTVMHMVIHDDNHLEVKLSTGLGQHIDFITKQVIFDHAEKMGNLCCEVMNRRTLESRQA